MSSPTIKIEGLTPGAPLPKPEIFKIKTDAQAFQGTVRALLAENDPLLKSVSEPFDFENPRFGHPISIAQSLIMSMRAYGGVGIAAIQVGMPVRVLAVGYGEQNQVFFNPEIIAISAEKSKAKEGCISFPFCFTLVERAERIRVKFQNEKGETKESDFSGYTARILQHEIDHLDGICLPDKVSELTWKLIKDKSRGLYKKALKMEKRQHVSGTR